MSGARHGGAVIRWIRSRRGGGLPRVPAAGAGRRAGCVRRQLRARHRSPAEFWHERVANTSAGVDTVLMVAVDAATDSWLGMTGCFVEDPSDGQALVVSVWVAPEARRRRRRGA